MKGIFGRQNRTTWKTALEDTGQTQTDEQTDTQADIQDDEPHDMLHS